MHVTSHLPWRAVALLATLTLLLTGCGGPEAVEDDPAAAEDDGTAEDDGADGAEAQEPITVSVVQSVDSLTFLPVYAAQTQGFYEEAGIELEITLGGVGGREVQALLGGEVGIAFSAGTELVKVAAQGRDVIAVQGMGHASAIAAMIHPDVAAEVGIDESASLEDRLAVMDGMTIGMTSPGALTDTIAHYWVAQAGLDDAAVEYIATGPPTGGVAALQAGDVDVLMSWSPFAEQMQAEGIGELFIDARQGADPSLSPWLEQTILTTREYAEENADEVSRLVQATTRGNEWILESDPEEIVDMVLTLEPFQALSREVLLPAVEVMQGSFTADGTITPEQLENIQAVLLVGGVIDEEIDADAHIDNSYLES